MGRKSAGFPCIFLLTFSQCSFPSCCRLIVCLTTQMTENCNYLCVIPGPGLCPMMLKRSFQVPKSRFSCHPAHCLQGLSEHRLFSREEICHCSILSSIFTYTNITGASVDRYVNLVVHSCIKVHDFRSVLVQEHTWLQAFNSETLVCVLACVISREGLSLLIHLPFLDDFKPDLKKSHGLWFSSRACALKHNSKDVQTLRPLLGIFYLVE